MKSGEREIDAFLAKHGKIFPAGSVICREGDEGNCMYFIYEGEIEITKKSGQKEKKIAVLTKGDFFGEISMLTGKPRSASAIARTDSIVIEIDIARFKNIIQKDPSLAIKILEKMADRLWRTDQIIENLLFRDRETQVINVLLQLSDEEGRVELDLDEIASRVSADDETVKMILYKLYSLGYITIKNNIIHLKEKKKLQQLRDFYQWKDSVSEST